MAATDYTSDAFIENVKRRASIPTNQSTWTDADILAMGNDEMVSIVIPDIFALQEEFFVEYVDYDLDTSSTTPQSFLIPANSLYSDVRSVTLPQSGLGEAILPRLNPQGLGTALPDYWFGFFIRANSIVVSPGNISGSPTLRVYYFRRPNYLVETRTAGQVEAIDTTNNLVTLSRVPADWTTGTHVCGVSNVPGFDLKFEDQAISSISSPQIGLPDVSDVEVGDWICLEGQSVIPQIPAEAHPLLAQATAVKYLEAQGDRDVSIAQEKYNQLLRQYIKVATPRSVGSPQKITGGNRIRDSIAWGPSWGRR